MIMPPFHPSKQHVKSTLLTYIHEYRTKMENSLHFTYHILLQCCTFCTSTDAHLRMADKNNYIIGTRSAHIGYKNKVDSTM